MRKLLPVILLLIGIGAGIGTGVMLRSEQQDTAMEYPCGDVAAQSDKTEATKTHEQADVLPEYVELNNQFVVPVVTNDMVDSLVVLSLGVELDPGTREDLYSREPKLRDALLQVLFDHANIGGFAGRFTDGNNMDVLRVSLKEAAQSVMGNVVRSVMITEIALQDI